MKCIGLHILILFSVFAAGCKPELPATSTITVDMESVTIPVNEGLYGLSVKEMERSDDSGMYAELIRNQSFEREDSLPGWRPLSPGTYLRQNTVRPVSPANPHSLVVSAYVSSFAKRGGVVAEGYNGIPVRKGEKYHLSFFIRTATSVTPVPVRIALEDSSASVLLSHVYEVVPSYDWIRYNHTFTATEDANNAVLTFSISQSSFFWIDMVSLAPGKTWKNRPRGLRLDLMEKIAALNPAFILYQGNTDSSFQDYLQMCEDLQAEPVYAVDSSKVVKKRLYAGENFFLSAHPLFNPDEAGYPAGIWVDGFSVAGAQTKGTLRAAVAEACFLIRAESAPNVVERLVYTPVTGYENDEKPYSPLITFNNHTSVASPSYYLLQMFARHRGDAVLKTEVNTYSRPQVVSEDSLCYDFSAKVGLPAGEGERVLLRVRDSVYLALGSGGSELYQLTGAVKNTLAPPQPFTFKGEHQVRIACRYDTIRCYIDDTLIHDAVLPPLPSLAANAVRDRQNQRILLKVVNTTYHNEITEINIRGASINSRAGMLQMKGLPEWRNTFDHPGQVEPVEQTVTLSTRQGRFRYSFPPHSVTILRLNIK
ncbi:MAG: carbohydrate binding domain-containing protein [Tannerellaceae bacterium]|jgi:hypothetical protein|nr:carbohydrate binding domain-containing protein [Tannerellaceae bacterium]